jgi:ubiquinone/menaquinone biosynthesis C-methylase UbiE
MSFFDSEVFKDAHSSYYEVLYSKKDHSAMCAEIVRLLNAELSEKRILEIGCGTGSFTTEL